MNQFESSMESFFDKAVDSSRIYLRAQGLRAQGVFSQLQGKWMASISSVSRRGFMARKISRRNFLLVGGLGGIAAGLTLFFQNFAGSGFVNSTGLWAGSGEGALAVAEIAIADRAVAGE